MGCCFFPLIYAYELIGQVSVELVDGFGGLQFAPALVQRSEELLELPLQGLLLGLQLRLVLPGSAVLPDGLLELLQLARAVAHLVLCGLVQRERESPQEAKAMSAMLRQTRRINQL